MRAVTAYLTLGLTLLVAGFGLWATARFERRVLDTHRQLLALDADASLRESEGIERSARRFRNLPWIAKLVVELGEQRATASYWQKDYSALAETGGDEAPVDPDPAIALIAANASFRRIRADAADRTAASRLEGVLGRYAEILRQRPQWFDVAYNYEIAARTRDRLARVTPARPEPGRDKRVPPAEPPTIHGLPGAPAEDPDLSDLKIIVPQRTDERRQQPDAGVGGAKPRKG